MNNTISTNAANISLTENEISPPRPLKEFWKYFSENKGAVIGLYFIIGAVLCAVFANVIAPHSPFDQYRDAILQPPCWIDGGSTRFLLGTDDVGRDILSRLVFGARLSLFVGVIVVTLSLAAGIFLGVTAGYFGGFYETVIMRLMDIMLALPSLLLAMAIVAILGPSLENAILAIAIVVLPHYVRLTRASVISEKSKDYVTASKVNGAGALRMMFNVILQNCT
ncbi:Dipeptide transport system permease protein DppC [Candidatus Magnetoovum chiemensis]|nr:Dipeptide transport system permease protein DppC [Candidatus Magnetoovum chiemensis]